MALVVPSPNPVKRVAAKRKRGAFTPLLLLAPALLWLGFFFVVPMVSLASQSLQSGSTSSGYTFTWAFSNYADAVMGYWPQFLRSFGFAMLATLITLLLGYPLAWFIAHRSGKFKTILLVLVIAPFFTNFLIRTLAWKIILSNDGVVSTVFRETGITSLLQMAGLLSTDTLLGSPFAVVAGLAYNFLPFMVLPLYASLERLDLRLVEASHDLYANGWQSFWKVIWPLSLPGVVSGTLLTFIPAAGDYINARLLGNIQTSMVGQVIDGQFLTVMDYPLAAALSFILMGTIIILVGLYIRSAGTEELV
jgi:spermidine/putrescine transport system permease protein